MHNQTFFFADFTQKKKQQMLQPSAALSFAISDTPSFHRDLEAHLQGLGGLVKIQDPVRRLSQQLHKLLGEQTQRRVVTRLLRRRLWS